MNRQSVDYSVEVTTPIGSGVSCPDLGKLPDIRRNTVGGILGDKMVICGGPDKSDCLYYDQELASWQFFAEMEDKRESAASIQIDGRTLWIAGGTDTYAHVIHQSSILLKVWQKSC